MKGSLESAPARLGARLPRAFFARPALIVAKDLLGKVLVHRTEHGVRAGVIVETEAYLGERDLASHASKGRTKRTDVMFGPPGRAYVYLVYGMHRCMNVVTGRDGIAEAVLLRAVEPFAGIPEGTRTDGPGRLTLALGIGLSHNRADLVAGSLHLCDAARTAGGAGAPRRRVARGPRIGVDYAGTWAARPYRFWLRDHPCVSR